MTSGKPSKPQIEAQELLLCDNPEYVCETYIFEPSSGEEKLGYLFAAAETQARDGVGKELLDVVLSAIQNEYFRDPTRSAVHSFELALHQANLILHDSSEKGVRDWMGYFHVAIGTLNNNQLHISVAGNAGVWVVRKSAMANIAHGLSHLPITDPLRTFSQVASGDIASSDTIFFSTPYFEQLFRPDDITRITVEHSAATISSRLQQLYTDQKQIAPLGLVTVTSSAHYAVPSQQEYSTQTYKPRSSAQTSPEDLKPRKPLFIRRSSFGAIMHGLGQMLIKIWQAFRTHAWPRVKKGSVQLGAQAQRGGKAIYQLSRSTGRSITSRASTTNAPTTPAIQERLANASQTITKAPAFFLSRLVSLPRTSKIFAVIALVLLMSLGVSLILLQGKRAEDKDVQRASELLHDARTKKDAAETALIYDNREQARILLSEAAATVTELSTTGLYVEEVNKLEQDIQSQNDRLQKITRADLSETQIVGSFKDVVTKQAPTHLFYLGETLYTFNPDTNAIAAMKANGAVTVANQDTKEIGFLTQGTTHVADKTLVFATDEPAIALFDTKTSSLAKQQTTFSHSNPSFTSIAVFGNRLYAYDSNAKNIFSYNKTLRGYVGETTWITDADFPKDTIKSISVDGSIYTLHTDGSIRELFKGEAAEFKAETVEPALTTATKITTDENMKNLYVLDPVNKRVVIYTKKGALIRQIFLDETISMQDAVIDASEENMFVLNGKDVVRVPLTQ